MPETLTQLFERFLQAGSGEYAAAKRAMVDALALADLQRCEIERAERPVTREQFEAVRESVRILDIALRPHGQEQALDDLIAIARG